MRGSAGPTHESSLVELSAIPGVKRIVMSSLKQFVKSHRALRSSLTPVVRFAKALHHAKRNRLPKALTELFQLVEEGSLVVRIPDFSGSFEIDSRSDTLRRVLTHGDYEPELVNFIKNTLDIERDAIDVGANVGLFTVLLSGLVSSSSRVLAIEPTPGALKYLRRNLDRNDSNDNVIVFEGAASSSSGKLALKVISGKEEYSSISNIVHPSVRNESYQLIDVSTETVDSLVERWSLNPGLIKMDTEGAEYDVLLGSTRTISTYRPIVLCESWEDELITRAGGSPDAVPKFFRERGYLISRPFGEEILAVPEETGRMSTRPRGAPRHRSSESRAAIPSTRHGEMREHKSEGID